MVLKYVCFSEWIQCTSTYSVQKFQKISLLAFLMLCDPRSYYLYIISEPWGLGPMKNSGQCNENVWTDIHKGRTIFSMLSLEDTGENFEL